MASLYGSAVYGTSTYGDALTVAYNNDLARVRITGYFTGQTSVNVYRSDDGGHTFSLIRGGAAVNVTSGTLVIDDYEFTPNSNTRYRVVTTPGNSAYEYLWYGYSVPTATWLKSPLQPFLNTPVTVTAVSDVTNDGRGGTFNVLGRTAPTYVADVLGARRFTLTCYAATLVTRNAIRLLAAFGDPVFFQPCYNNNGVLPSQGWFAITALTERRPPKHNSVARYLDLELSEVQAPDVAYGGHAGNYTGLNAAYATYTALNAAFATYLALSQFVTSTSDVTVG